MSLLFPKSKSPMLSEIQRLKKNHFFPSICPMPRRKATVLLHRSVKICIRSSSNGIRFIFFYLCNYLFIFAKENHTHTGEGGDGEREIQADFLLSMKPDLGLDLTTPTLRPEPKSGVGLNWAIQVPQLGVTLKNEILSFLLSWTEDLPSATRRKIIMYQEATASVNFFFKFT